MRIAAGRWFWIGLQNHLNRQVPAPIPSPPNLTIVPLSRCVVGGRFFNIKYERKEAKIVKKKTTKAQRSQKILDVFVSLW